MHRTKFCRWRSLQLFVLICMFTAFCSSEENIEAVNTTTVESIPVFSEKDNFVPGKPRNLSVVDVTSTTIKISWFEPNKTKVGHIHGYRIYSTHNSQTINHIPLFKPDPDVGSGPYFYTLSGLKPFTEYKIYVIAVTRLNDGEPSENLVQKTDVSGPSPPTIVNFSCTGENSLYLRWKKPDTFYNNIDSYIISYRSLEKNSFQDIKIDNSSSNHAEIAMVLPNLTFNMIYEAKVRAASLSIIKPQQLILGSYSQARKADLYEGCENNSASSTNQKKDTKSFYLVPTILILIIISSLIFFLWKKYFKRSYFHIETGHQTPTFRVDWNLPIEIGDEVKTSIPVDEFADHTAKLHADGDFGFSKEYELIQNDNMNDFSSEFSLHPENKAKNRYLNITAYDHSRVPLFSTNNPKKESLHASFYINANFIDGYDKPKAFIATQGPLQETISDFWNMVYQQGSEKIVCVTHLVERGRRKCDRYWPTTEALYGNIHVKLMKEDVLSTYTIREFSVMNIKFSKKKYPKLERKVFQYHYTNWPDHGTPPDHPLPILNFVRKSSSYTTGPIIVHCSAGVGRTGTYIMLDAMLRQIKDRNELNIFGFLKHIRTQRNFLVQTEEQYIFIHDALKEAIISGESCFERSELMRCAEDSDFMEQQYKQIVSTQPKNFELSSATSQFNFGKNRSHILPLENGRVIITRKPGVEGSDYINATFLHGFRRLRDFIVTQHPIEGSISTVLDFWQMVFDSNSQAIVLLSPINQEYPQFWPQQHDVIKSDYYQLKHTSSSEDGSVINLSMSSVSGDFETEVSIFLLQEWPNMSNSGNIFQQIYSVYLNTSYKNRGPVIVVDEFGGATACTFCITASIMMELEHDSTANIYTYAKMHHNKRPGVWSGVNDVKKLYEIASLYNENLDLHKLTDLSTEFDDALIANATSDPLSKAHNGSVKTQSPIISSRLAPTNGNIFVNLREENEHSSVAFSRGDEFLTEN